MRNLSLAVVAALFAVVIGVRAEDKKPAADQPFDDAAFVAMAASSGMHEVELGTIAKEKAKNENVKKFADTMVRDHTKANEELKTAAKAAGIPVPDKMSEKHQKHVEMFKNYKGDNFDADYLKHMVESHTQGLALFKRASKEAKSKELKDFATKFVPAVDAHLGVAKNLSKDLVK
jgi:putative membrane protein